MLDALTSLLRRVTSGRAAITGSGSPDMPEEGSAANCFHCGLPLPAGARDRVLFEGRAHRVCCAACAALAETVIANGYGDYYRERDRLAATA